MPQSAVQEADGELLMSVQRADYLIHRAAVTRCTRCTDHQVDVTIADLLLELRLLTPGDQTAAIAADADVALGHSIRGGAGAGLERGQREHCHCAHSDSQQPFHAVNLPSCRGPGDTACEYIRGADGRLG